MLQIFDVEHGQCSLFTGPTGDRLLIDAGHNSTTGWRPSLHLAYAGATKVDELILTNADEDHVSDLPQIVANFPVRILRRNPSVSAGTLRLLKAHGGMGGGINTLCSIMGGYDQPVTYRPNFGGLQISSYCNRYPDFADENNLSLVTILKWPGFSICYPGDMEVAGWRALVRDPLFCAEIARVDVLVASHHGRANGCSEELFQRTGWRPRAVIISDAGIQHATQETCEWYRSRSQGICVIGDPRERRVITTRTDGTITFTFDSAGFWCRKER